MNCVVPITRSAGISTFIRVGGAPMYMCELLPAEQGILVKSVQSKMITACT